MWYRDGPMPVGLAILQDVVRWWAKQMRTLLPQSLLPDAGQADALLVAADGMPDAPRIRLSLRRRRRETPLGNFHLREAGLRKVAATIRQPPRRVVLRPDTAVVLERKVLLPLAAEHDVARVLRYEMDRFTPFTAEQVFWSSRISRRDRAAGRLELRLSLMPKSLLQPILGALEDVGLRVNAIETASRSGEPVCVDLVPPSPRRRRLLAMASCAAAALALVAFATPFVTQSLALGSVEVAIAVLQPRIAQVETLRRRVAAGSAGNDVIAAEHARVGDALQVLATVTELLPDDTYSLICRCVRASSASADGRAPHRN